MSFHKILSRVVHARVTASVLTTLFIAWWLWHWIARPPILTNLSPALSELINLFEYAVALTLVVLWITIVWYANNRANRVFQDVDREALYRLSPYEFEAYVGEIFRARGDKVKQRGGSGDQGVDIEVRQRVGGRYRDVIVQCKRYKSTVSPDTVRELYGTLLHEKADHAFLVTTADISDSSYEWAKDKPLTLVDGETLVDLAHALLKNKNTTSK